MAIRLKQSTASQEVPLGQFVSVDGITPETAHTVSAANIHLHKSGSATLANKNSGDATHMSLGIFVATFDATDTDTLGPLTIYTYVTGFMPLKQECEVMTSAAYHYYYELQGAASVGSFVCALADTTGVSFASAVTGSPIYEIVTNVSGGGGTADVSAVSAMVSAINVVVVGLSAAVSQVLVHEASISAQVVALSAAISVAQAAVSTAISVQGAATSVVLANVSAAVSSVDAHVSTVSVGLSLLDVHVSTVSVATSIYSAALSVAISVAQANVSTAISVAQANVSTAISVAHAGTSVAIANVSAGLSTLGVQVSNVSVAASAIRAKTNQLVFTKTNEVDVNVQSINGVEITGDGSANPYDVP